MCVCVGRETESEISDDNDDIVVVQQLCMEEVDVASKSEVGEEE